VDDVSLDDILVTPLKRIPTVGGDVLHALKKTDAGFDGFGEIYFSWVEQGAVKAWKYHKRMTLNLVVPVGEVSFVFHLTNQKNNFRTENIGEERYVRLTVPPGIWFGFQGRGCGQSLLMNLADMAHEPDEVDFDRNLCPENQTRFLEVQ
jgi:dTDP-4-dehydrorhamnose 3,5-epimerase